MMDCGIYKNNTHEQLFDIAKGIAIILVVTGHLRTSDLCYKFIYLFHMVFFFVLAGYFFKESCYQSADSVICFIRNKAKKLLFPYLAVNILFEILHNFFIKIHFYASDVNFAIPKFIQTPYTNIQEPIVRFFTTIEPLAAPSWFLYVLFFALSVYCIINYICNKLPENNKLAKIVLILSFLAVGFYLGEIHFKFLYIGTICSVLICLYIGELFAKYKADIKYNVYTAFVSFILLLFFAFSLKNTVHIATSQYYNPCLLILLSITGFVFVISLSSLIKNKTAKSILSYTGRNTVPILLLHYIAFKFVSFFIIKIRDLPIEYLSYPSNEFSSDIYIYIYLQESGYR